ncbi:16333_t:CDS:2, partial [Racocetra persica]
NEQYKLELILGEISYGPFNETYKHTFEDRIKLNKEAKDSLDKMNCEYDKESIEDEDDEDDESDNSDYDKSEDDSSEIESETSETENN